MQGFTIERAFSRYIVVREPFSAVAAMKLEISAYKTKFGASASSAVVPFAVIQSTMTCSGQLTLSRYLIMTSECLQTVSQTHSVLRRPPLDSGQLRSFDIRAFSRYIVVREPFSAVAAM